jgi:DNA primase
MGAFEQAKEEIRARADIVSVVGRRVPLKRKGAHWAGRCPFHDDHDPSLHVNPVLGIYKCFVCGAGGDVFKFVMEHEHLGFREALEQLAAETGVALPEKAAQDPQEVSRSTAARAALDWAQGVFHQELRAAPAVLDYARRRGLTDGEIEDFKLGFAPDGDVLLNRGPAAGHSVESLEAAGLVVRNDSGRWRDRFRVRLVFPLCDLSRRVVGFAGRNLRSGRSDIPKYLNSPETEFYRKSHFLFGLGHARSEVARAGEAVVVEGYMDWHALWRHGIRNAVAASGTAFTRDQARLLSRQAKRVVCFFDGDRAGVAAAERSLPVLLSEGLEVRVANLEGTGAKDPDELLKSGGPEALRERLTGARHWVHFLLNGFRVLAPRPTPDQRADFIRRIRTLLAAIPDPQLREQCAREAHPYLEVLGIRASQLEEASAEPAAAPSRPLSGPSARLGEPAGNRRVQNPPKRGILSGIAKAEARFLFNVLSHPVLVLDARDHVQPSDLTDPSCRALWDVLVASSELDDAPPDVRAVAAGLDPTLAGFATDLFQLSEVRPDELTARRELDDFVRDLKARRLKERRRQLAAEARIAGEADPSKLAEWNELMAQEAAILSSTRMES